MKILGGNYRRYKRTTGNPGIISCSLIARTLTLSFFSFVTVYPRRKIMIKFRVGTVLIIPTHAHFLNPPTCMVSLLQQSYIQLFSVSLFFSLDGRRHFVFRWPLPCFLASFAEDRMDFPAQSRVRAVFFTGPPNHDPCRYHAWIMGGGLW